MARSRDRRSSSSDRNRRSSRSRSRGRARRPRRSRSRDRVSNRRRSRSRDRDRDRRRDRDRDRDRRRSRSRDRRDRHRDRDRHRRRHRSCSRERKSSGGASGAAAAAAAAGPKPAQDAVEAPNMFSFNAAVLAGRQLQMYNRPAASAGKAAGFFECFAESCDVLDMRAPVGSLIFKKVGAPRNFNTTFYFRKSCTSPTGTFNERYVLAKKNYAHHANCCPSRGARAAVRRLNLVVSRGICRQELNTNTNALTLTLALTASTHPGHGYARLYAWSGSQNTGSRRSQLYIM